MLEEFTEPCNWTGALKSADWSGPALTEGAPGERGPSLGPVVWMTSKLVMLMLVKSLKQFSGQRSSGVTEMEKKFPLSATIAPYFLSPSNMAFSSIVQLAGMTKDDFSRNRWPIAGRLTLVFVDGAAKCVAG